MGKSLNSKLDKRTIYFGIIYCIAIVSRLIFLKSSPAGLHVDEAGMAYDAYCLANYGVDRNLLSFPVYLINFGGGQSALYAYMAAVFVKFMGLSIVAIRLPGVISSLITLFAGEKIVKRICGENSPAAYIYPIIFTGCPAFVMSARFGLDCNLMLGMTTLFIYALLRAVDSGKCRDYIFAGIMSGISLYTYAICYAIMPLFLLLTFIVLIITKRLNILRVISFVIPLAILATPLLITQYVNITGSESIVFGIITMPALTFYRGGEIGAPSLAGFLNTLKCTFLFDSLDYNSIPAFGTIYYMTIPFVVVGFVLLMAALFKKLKKMDFAPEVTVVFWFLSEILIGSMLGGDGPNVNKMNGIFFTVAFFAAYGAEKVISLFTEKRKLYVVLCTVLGCTFIAFTGAFFIKYLGTYSDNLYLFQKPIDEPIKVLETKEEFADKQVVVIHDNQPYIPPYIYYLLGTKLSPYEFNMGDTSYYARYLFYTPEELSPDYVYLVFAGNPEATQRLQKIGCNQILELDGASIIYSGEPIDYDRSELNEEKKSDGIPFGHDLPFHLRRIGGIAEGLKAGEFPVKMQHFWFNNYGYPVGVMYGDALLYIPAVLHIMGMPLWRAYLCYMILIQALTLLTGYICFKYLSGKRIAGIICTILYFLSFWRLTDLFSREAVGEYSAFAFLPLVVLGLARIHRNDNLRRGAICLVLGITGLFMTHLLSVVMTVLFVLLFIIIDAKNMLPNGKWKVIGAAGLAAVILNLWQAVPLIDYYKNVPMLINSGEGTKIQTFGITWRQMLGGFYDVLAPIKELGTEPIDELPQSPGLALLAVLIMGIIYLISSRKELKKHISEIAVWVLCIIALILSTCYFPYDLLFDKARVIFKILGSIQYPARYLTAATVLICSLFALIQKKRQYYILGALLIILSLWQSGAYVNSFLEKQTNTVSLNTVDEWTSFDDDRQYMLVDTDTERLQYASVLPSSDEISYSDEERNGGEYSLKLSNNSGEEGYADLPLLSYPYYYGTDGTISYKLSSGDNNKLRITLPAGTDSVIRIRFREPLYWRAAELISLIFAIAMTIFLKIKKSKA
ncbi:glycosyltransferase family 39 protein [Butyrivibrio sp. JL13D10]|uniref:glycosyltransferase family 39 protein n=1 Tax=Butyrivibrio sp. JL13D10 TaxID=3236815 RepID=UPI0038B4A66D